VEYSDVQNFLPSFLFSERGTKRLDLELSALAVGPKSNLSKLQILFPRLIGLSLETTLGAKWSNFARSFKVPTPMILEGLHRSKIIKEKGKDVTLTKKPKRPSKRIEVLSVQEANILTRLETPFDEYKNYLEHIGNEVDIDKIRIVRAKVSKLIQDMWKVVERVSAPLTKRRTALVSHMTDNERKKLNINKGFIQSCINNQFADCKDDKGRLYTLSPIPLVLKCGSQEEVISASKCDVQILYVLIPYECAETVREVLVTYASLINVPVVDQRPVIKKKSRKAQQVEEFEDDTFAPRREIPSEYQTDPS